VKTKRPIEILPLSPEELTFLGLDDGKILNLVRVLITLASNMQPKNQEETGANFERQRAISLKSFRLKSKALVSLISILVRLKLEGDIVEYEDGTKPYDFHSLPPHAKLES